MFGDLARMMKMAAQVHSKLPELKDRLESTTYTGSAGGGVVQAMVNGKLTLTDIKIDPEFLAAEECEPGMLEDLVKAAVSSAQGEAARAGQEAMRELTGGMDLPGMDQLMP